MAENKIVAEKETAFTKHQIINSKKYLDRKDVLNVLLKDDTSYTIKEVDKLINDFMKKGVK